MTGEPEHESPENLFDLTFGCDGCGATTRISGIPISDVIYPQGVELGCPKCKAFVGPLAFVDKNAFLSPSTP
jgi:hypothetical protein